MHHLLLTRQPTHLIMVLVICTKLLQYKKKIRFIRRRTKQQQQPPTMSLGWDRETVGLFSRKMKKITAQYSYFNCLHSHCARTLIYFFSLLSNYDKIPVDSMPTFKQNKTKKKINKRKRPPSLHTLHSYYIISVKIIFFCAILSNSRGRKKVNKTSVCLLNLFLHKFYCPLKILTKTKTKTTFTHFHLYLSSSSSKLFVFLSIILFFL